MVRVSVENEQEYLSLNAACLPEADELIKKWRSLPELPLQEAPEDPHFRQAWAVNCWGTYYARLRGYSHRLSPSLQTWILRAPAVPTAECRLGSWFRDKPEDYRVLIHRGPSSPIPGKFHPSRRVWDCFLRNRRIPAEQERTQQMKCEAENILRELLKLYTPPGMIENHLFKRMGHPYAHSSASPYS